MKVVTVKGCSCGKVHRHFPKQWYFPHIGGGITEYYIYLHPYRTGQRKKPIYIFLGYSENYPKEIILGKTKLPERQDWG